MSDSRLIRCSVRLYGAMLRLYPAAFRRDYGAVMALDFHDTLCRRYQQDGLRGLMGTWLWALGDLSRNVAAEYARVAGQGLRSQPVQRGCEIGVSLGGLAVGLPFFPLVALLIKLESPGPVFFVQRRAGQNGVPFPMFKLRTMADVPQGKKITRVGGVLRRLHVDEMPQFVNVLRGEMALRGPRPGMWSHEIVPDDYSADKPGLLPRHDDDTGV